MKQVKLICTLALALVALAACNPFDQADPNPAGSNPQESTANVILNLNLAPMDAPGTKGTTKQAWEDGDYVYLFFAPTGTASYSDLNNVIVKYDEGNSEWVVESDSQVALNDIDASGKVLAIYTFGGKRTIVDDSLKGLFHLGDASDDPTKAYGLTFSQVGDYTFIPGDPGEVCLNLTLERVGKTQITVTGITNDTNNQWVLYNCGTGAEVFSGVGQLSAKFEGGDFVTSALLTSMDEVPGVNNGSGNVTFTIGTIDDTNKSVRLILHNTKTKKNYIRILDGTKVTPGTAYTTEAPTLDGEGNISVDKGWKQGFLIEYTATADPELTSSTVVANEYDSESQQGYVIFSDGCPSAAFAMKTVLTSAVIQKGVTSIDTFAFNSCNALETIDFPSTLTTIGMNAFYSCTALRTIVLPSTVTTIGQGAFTYCNALETIDLPSGLETIGNTAFGECAGLTTVICRATNPPTWGDEYVFFMCYYLQKIKVPAASVATYKSAPGWSGYDDKIEAIDE